MTARGWVSPLPAGIGAGVKLFRRVRRSRMVAEFIVERAWRGCGVHVFTWPCGTLAVVAVGVPSDRILLEKCLDQLRATYARHGAGRSRKLGNGPDLDDVIDDINWFRGQA